MEIIRYVNGELIEEFKNHEIGLIDFIRRSGISNEYSDFGRKDIPIKITIPDEEE